MHDSLALIRAVPRNGKVGDDYSPEFRIST
jgi:hypothetical protein